MFKPVSVILLENSKLLYTRLAIEFFLMLAITLVLNPILDSEVSHSENLKFALCMASALAIGNFLFLKMERMIDKSSPTN